MADIKDDVIDLDQILQTGANNDRADDPVILKEGDDGYVSPPVDTNPPTPPTPPEEEEEEEENEDKELKEFGTLLQLFNTGGADVEDRTLLNNLLQKHKGTSFDAEGNIVNDNNEIVKTFKDLYADINTEEVTLDSKGNQIDTDVNVVKTKLELAIDNTYVNKLHKNSGFEFLDESGEVKIYEDTEEGINNYTEDLAQEKAKKISSSIFNAYPDVPEIIKHLSLGKDLSTFNSSVDYTKLDVKTLSKEQKLAYIKQSLDVQGMEEERRDNYLTLIEDSNGIDKELEMSLRTLQNHDDQLKAERNQQIGERQKANKERAVAHWSDVQAHIKDNKVKFVTIPENEKDAFYDYMALAVDEDGNSKHMIDRSAQSTEEEVGLAYLRFKGFDFNSVIKGRVTKSKAMTIRDRLKRSADVKNQADSTNKQEPKSSTKDIRISDILPQ
jgi:hypothetical protein